MEIEKKGFPQYRKYSNVDVWFKIDGENEFTEIKRVGDRYIITKVIAKQFPELLLIKDMIECSEKRWGIVSEEAVLDQIKKAEPL